MKEIVLRALEKKRKGNKYRMIENMTRANAN